jgi:hypothetical protein
MSLPSQLISNTTANAQSQQNLQPAPPYEVTMWGRTYTFRTAKELLTKLEQDADGTPAFHQRALREIRAMQEWTQTQPK